MEKNEIVVGEDYAYITPGILPHQPLRAVVNEEAEGGYVEVTVYHPDTGQSTEKAKTRELVGAWDDEPTGRAQYERQIAAAHERGEKFTWHLIADQRYAMVARQRALAARLSRLGIVRQGRNYAGAGGNSSKPHDTDLQLNYDEIEHLLDLVERGPGSSVPAWVDPVDDDIELTDQPS